MQRATGERRRRTVRHPVSVTPCTTFFITTSKSCVCGNSLSCSDLSVYSEGAHKMFIYSRNVGQGPTAVTLQCPRPQTRAPAWHPVLRGRSEQPRSPSSLSGTPPAPSPEKKGKWRRNTSKSLPGLNGFAGVGVKRSHFTGSPPARFPVQDAVAPQQRPGSPDSAASGKPAGRDTCPGSASVPAGPRTAGPGAHAGGLRPCRAHSGAVFRLALGDASGPPLGQASREDPVKSQAPLLLGDTAEALGSRRSELSSKALPTFVPSASVRGSPGTAAAGVTRVGQLALAGENTMNFRSHTFQNLSLSCL